MKSDLDRIMAERGIDALWVTGPSDHNPNMVYFTGIQHITSADLIIKQGQPPLLFHYSMERDEALKTGLKTINYSNYSLAEYLKKTNGDALQASALINKALLEDLDLSQSNIFVSGKTELGSAFSLLQATQQLVPTITIAGGYQDEPFKIARMTKDSEEIAHIRRVGELTVEVVGLTADFLCNQQVKDDILVNDLGQPITVGDIKTKIRLWMSERNLEMPEGMIFSLGRDTAVPHSAGQAEDVIRLGVPIIFDIYPCEAGGGYFYDFTRTWCLGTAPQTLQDLHAHVLKVHHTIISELEIGHPFKYFQERTCDLFEQMGHTTIAMQPESEEGYIHSLGHGIGLEVHEKPFSGLGASDLDVLKSGVVMTIEPGLYYPSRAMGVRVEDSVFADEQGNFKILADYPYDLVLPIKNKS